MKMAVEWAESGSTVIGTAVVGESEGLLEHLTDEETESLAALAGAPDGVAELAFVTMPTAMQDWAQTYGLVHFEDQTAKISNLGWRTIDAAAAVYPRPFADVDMGQIKMAISQAVSELPPTEIVVTFVD
jgi:hypothetical protein